MSHFIMKTATAFSQADAQEISRNSNKENVPGFKVTPFEGILLVPEGNSSAISWRDAELSVSPPLLQHNPLEWPPRPSKKRGFSARCLPRRFFATQARCLADIEEDEK
jgi:hypothetical protein